MAMITIRPLLPRSLLYSPSPSAYTEVGFEAQAMTFSLSHPSLLMVKSCYPSDFLLLVLPVVDIFGKIYDTLLHTPQKKPPVRKLLFANSSKFFGLGSCDNCGDGSNIATHWGYKYRRLFMCFEL